MSTQHSSTYVVPADAAGHNADRSRRGPIGLTLCFHPELDRIGEVAALEFADGAARIDRESPRFRQPGADRPARGLDTSFVSQRHPVVLELRADGSARVVSASAQASVHLPERAAGAPAAGVTIAAEAIDGPGALVTLNRTVALLLHRLAPDAERCDADALLEDARALVARARQLASALGDSAPVDVIARAQDALRRRERVDAATLASVARALRAFVGVCGDAAGVRAAALAHDADAVLRRAARLDRIQNGVVGESRALQALWEEIASMPGSGPVLIVGERGCGKTDAARALARFSRRRGPFVYRNAANLTASVASAELFGRKKGFLGPGDPGLAGLFRSAHAGTLFLDEVAELADDVQAKLLDAAERGFITPLGEDELAVDVRLITATNQDLSAIAFKKDLYDRLAGLRLRVPSLRERRDDIPRLLVHFLREAWAGRVQQPLAGKEQRAEWAAGWAAFVVRMLVDPWPGNVRVLRELARRMAAANPLALDSERAPFVEPAWPEAAAPIPALEPATPTVAGKSGWSALIALPVEQQRAQLEQLLAASGSQLKAALALGTSGATLNRHCKKLGLSISSLDDTQLADPPKWANVKAVSELRNQRWRSRRPPPRSS